MKQVLAVIACIALLSSLSFAQRRTVGNSRETDNTATGTASEGARPSRERPVEPYSQPQPPPPPPPAPVIVQTPVPPPPPGPFPILPPPMEIEGPPCKPIQVVHVTVIEAPEPIEKPEILRAILWDATGQPAQSCFDFSAEEVVPQNSRSSDVKFIVSDGVPQFVVGNDADIQVLDSGIAFEDVERTPTSGWSATHGVVVEPENVYVIWTWDNQFYKFAVTTLSDERVAFTWERLDQGMRIASDETYRNGSEHRIIADRFGQ